MPAKSRPSAGGGLRRGRLAIFLSHLCGEIALKFWLSFLEPPPKGHRPGNAWGNAGGNTWDNARTTMGQHARKAFYQKCSHAPKSSFPCRRNAYLRKGNCFRGRTKLISQMGTSIFSNPSVIFDHLPSHKSNLEKCAQRYFLVDICGRQQNPGPRLAWASDAAGWPFFFIAPLRRNRT